MFPSLAVPELKRIGKLRPSLGKQHPMELLLTASTAHHMCFCISFFPRSLYFLVSQRQLGWSGCYNKSAQKPGCDRNLLLAQLAVTGGWHVGGHLSFTWSSGDSGMTVSPSSWWGSEDHCGHRVSSSQPEGKGHRGMHIGCLRMAHTTRHISLAKT